MTDDPLLGSLANNGGLTMTCAVLPGSPTFDASDCSGGSVSVDQRNVIRPNSMACAIGAFERFDLGYTLYLPIIKHD